MTKLKFTIAAATLLAATLLLSPQNARAQTHVQWASNNACTYEASCSFSFGSNTTAGNLIVACAGFNNGTSAPTFSDSEGDTFSSAIARFNNGSAALICYYSANIHGGADTVTCSISGSGYCIPAAEEITGAATSAPLDQTGTATVSSATPSATTTGSISQPNEIVIGAGMDWTAARTWSAGSGFTNHVSVTNSSQCGCAAGMESETLTSGSGTQTATFSIGVADATAIAVMTYKAAPTGGCTPSLMLLHESRCD